MRGAWAVVLVACSPGARGGALDGSVPLPADAGATAPDIVIGIRGTTRFSVVRGESVQIPFLLGGRDVARAVAVAAIGLPAGLSTDTTVLNGATDGTVTIHAAPDAPQIDFAADLVTAGGGSATFEMSVVGVDGSLDPSFGAGGRLDLAGFSGWLLGIAATPGGVLVVGADHAASTDRVRAVRFLADGSLDPSFANGGSLVYAYPGQPTGATPEAFAACEDGSFAVVAADEVAPVDGGSPSTEYRALYFDASGAATGDVLLPPTYWLPWSVACTGGALLTTMSGKLLVVDSSHDVHLEPLPGTSVPWQVAATPSRAYVASSSVIALAPDPTGTWTIDSTFGTSGSLALPGLATATALDVGGDLAVALAGPGATMTRVLPSGALDVAFGTSGVATVPFDDPHNATSANVVRGPSGDTFVVGASSAFLDVAVARLDAAGALVPTFGAHGITVTTTAVQASPRGAVLDGAGHLWVALSRWPATPAFLARYRVVSP